MKNWCRTSTPLYGDFTTSILPTTKYCRTYYTVYQTNVDPKTKSSKRKLKALAAVSEVAFKVCERTQMLYENPNANGAYCKFHWPSIQVVRPNPKRIRRSTQITMAWRMHRDYSEEHERQYGLSCEKLRLLPRTIMTHLVYNGVFTKGERKFSGVK